MERNKACNASTDRTTNHWLNSYQIGNRRYKGVETCPQLEFGLPVPGELLHCTNATRASELRESSVLPAVSFEYSSSSTNLASPNKVLMTILGLPSFGCFYAERRFNATHGWAPGFDKSRSDSHENIGNQQRSHTLQCHKWPWSAAA